MQIPKMAKQLSTKIRFYSKQGIGQYCPICKKWAKTFRDYGNPARRNAQCPWCGSLERHRLTWAYFEKMTNLLDKQPKYMLHIAPEPSIEAKLKRELESGYVSADLINAAMIKMDITNIEFQNEAFDVIYCSHVLEHIPDDRRAIRELHRILKPSGWAIILVPISSSSTFEDPTVTDPAARRRLFGQEDHVRCYGPDYIERLQNAGFDVSLTKAADFLTKDEIQQMGLTKAAGEIYYCTKKSNN